MFRRLLLIVTIVSLIAPPAHAQLAVIDPANLVQTTLIAYRMQQHYAELRGRVPDRPSNGTGAGQHGPLPDSHDPHHRRTTRAAGTYGRPWIQALNSGDATGAAYLSTTAAAAPAEQPSHER